MGQNTAWTEELSFNTNILQGTNTVSIIVTNVAQEIASNPAGLIASVYSDSSASFIVKTDSTWTWTLTYGGIY